MLVLVRLEQQTPSYSVVDLAVGLGRTHHYQELVEVAVLGVVGSLAQQFRLPRTHPFL